MNYSLFNQKITFEFLKSHLWSAADILRGSLDPSEYRQPVMTILFIKRLNDTFEENAEKLISEGKSQKEAYENRFRHQFFIPKEARWSVLSKASENIGQLIDDVCRIIERENRDLDGVLTNTKYNDKRKYPDDKLRKLISHFNSPRLRNSDLEKEDIFGDAYEYLLAEFADETKKKGGEFFTPREVVRLLVNLVEPKEGMRICDPTCGSGGMLIESRKYVELHHGNPRDLVLEGQESNYGNLAMCKMNMVLHGIEDFNIEYGDVLGNPKLVEGGKLKTYDRVLANFPFSMDWDNKVAAKDPYNRFRFGIPPEKDKADFAFIQHMFSSLNVKGKAAIICSQGVLFRGNEEQTIRKNIIKEDIIEGIIALPPKLFYGTGIPGCLLILNRNKSPKK
ncbi:type I restriction-modification system subunit M [Nitrososphaera sp. AFS]|uniref:type I restriction-modification system subunit M n=1 Tax=Nitrososphaera sp. AFS TaxID=2301191 RepID=UPI00351B5A78